MKKFLAIVMALVMVLALAACGGNTTNTTTAPQSNQGDNQGDNQNTASGRVYWLNFKPESDAALQEIAKMYTAETGVEVFVSTAASGK